MSGKIVVCRCEDVMRDDLSRAIAAGYRDIEEVKRYTGFGTGPCQGKECLRHAALLVAELSGVAPADVPAFTSRPPLVPVALKYFARDPSAAGD